MTRDFTLDDFREQLVKMKNVEEVISDLVKMIPDLSEGDLRVDVDEIRRYEAIIQAMTPKERQRPEIVELSRGRRIAEGSGTDVKEVSRLVEQFEIIRDMMKRMPR